MVWVQTVCKDYQQRTLVDKELNLYSIITSFDAFEISWIFMENGAFALLKEMLHFHNIFKRIQNLTKIFLDIFNFV